MTHYKKLHTLFMIKKQQQELAAEKYESVSLVMYCKFSVFKH